MNCVLDQNKLLSNVQKRIRGRGHTFPEGVHDACYNEWTWGRAVWYCTRGLLLVYERQFDLLFNTAKDVIYL